MRLNRKTILLIILGIFFVFLPISATNFNFKNSEFSDGIRVDNENLKIAVISGKIHIDNNWGAAKSAGICTGNGTYSEPYIIEDLVIDSGGLGSCILIENSNVFFKIENCTVYNSAPMGVPMGGDSGIMLYNTNNSQLIKNNCLSTFVGIRLFNSYNNTISGNTANNTGGHGIEIFSSTNNTISGNTVDSGTLLYFSDSSGLILSVSDNNIIANNSMYRGRYGINIHFCRNITISKNKMYDCGLNLYGYLSSDSIIVDTTNLVNGKPVYYYNNKMNLGSDNFRNAGQLILYDCHESLIENLNVSYGSTGISLDKCNNNSITGNIASHNKNDGIYLSESYNNTIRENTLDGNFDSGIDLEYSYDNTVSNNNASDNFDGISSWICDRNIVSGNILSNNRGDGVYLHDSDFNNITDNIANKNQFSGVFLHYSSNNLITRNTLNKNSLSGVYLIASDFNTISENILIENGKCIKEENCEGNIFINNTCTGIFPLKLVIIISTISGITLIGITTILLIRRKRKRIE